MGRNYYCEYCDKSFRDVLAVRKTHLKGALHQQMKKEHFDRFRGEFIDLYPGVKFQPLMSLITDISTFLEEERAKLPCPRLLKNLECLFGSRCRYSHYSPSEIDQIELKDKQAKETKGDRINENKPINTIPWKYNDLQLHHNDSLPPSLRQWTTSSFQSLTQ